MSRVAQRELLERDRLAESDKSLDTRKLWISDRIYRVASLQDMAERIEEQVAEYRDVDEITNPYERGDARYNYWEPPKRKALPAMLIREYAQILRQVAEELGQLPNATPSDTDGAVYTVVGLSNSDLDKLR